MRLIVLGTGTAVGKTYVTTHLARALAQLDPSRPLLALKPVETGVFDPDTDAARLAAVAHLAVPPTPHPLFAFPQPLSPHLAARRAGTDVTIPAIARWVRDATIHYTASPIVLIETPGGAFSPLTPSATNFDLASAFDPAIWLLVGPDALGVLHDLTVTLLALRARHRPPDLVLLTAARPADPSTGTNASELAALGICRVAAVLPHDDPAPLDPVARALLSRPDSA